MTPIFERAAIADAETITEVQIRAFHDDARLYPGVEMGGPPGYDSVEIVRKDIQEQEYYKIVYEGQIVGGILLFDWGEGHLHLDRLFIDPDFHNRGIGSQAMEFIEERYPADRWSLHTPIYATRNRHFYEKFGYVKTGEETFDGQVWLIEYQKYM